MLILLLLVQPLTGRLLLLMVIPKCWSLGDQMLTNVGGHTDGVPRASLACSGQVVTRRRNGWARKLACYIKLWTTDPRKRQLVQCVVKVLDRKATLPWQQRL